MKKIYADNTIDISTGDFAVPTGCTRSINAAQSGYFNDEGLDLFNENESDPDLTPSSQRVLPTETMEEMDADSTDIN